MSGQTKEKWHACMLRGHQDPGFEIYARPYGIDVVGWATTLDRARLIAAAPELLDALLEVYFDGLATNMERWQTKARSAIAKATGGAE